MRKSTSFMLIMAGIVVGTGLSAGILVQSRMASARQAPEPSTRMAGAAGETKTATATVEAMDREKRTVTLKTEQGKTMTVNVPPEATGFEQNQEGRPDQDVLSGVGGPRRPSGRRDQAR